MSGALYMLVGASGAGKTTLLRTVRRDCYPGLLTHHVDDLGVPTAQDIARDFGDGAHFQAHQIRGWIRRATEASTDGRLLVVDGQARPSAVRDVSQEAGFTRVTTVLVDCDHTERRRRLIWERRQPELDVLDTYAWASYLKGQADALGTEVLDTTGQTLGESVRALGESLIRAAARHAVRLEDNERDVLADHGARR